MCRWPSWGYAYVSGTNLRRCFFDFGFDPDRSEAAASRHLNANAVAEDDCSGDVIQRQNATTPNRATVPFWTVLVYAMDPDRAVLVGAVDTRTGCIVAL